MQLSASPVRNPFLVVILKPRCVVSALHSELSGYLVDVADQEQLEILRTIASAGAALEDISGRLARLAPVSQALLEHASDRAEGACPLNDLQADVLVDVVLAIAERGFSSDALASRLKHYKRHALASALG